MPRVSWLGVVDALPHPIVQLFMVSDTSGRYWAGLQDQHLGSSDELLDGIKTKSDGNMMQDWQKYNSNPLLNTELFFLPTKFHDSGQVPKLDPETMKGMNIPTQWVWVNLGYAKNQISLRILNISSQNLWSPPALNFRPIPSKITIHCSWNCHLNPIIFLNNHVQFPQTIIYMYNIYIL